MKGRGFLLFGIYTGVYLLSMCICVPSIYSNDLKGISVGFSVCIYGFLSNPENVW